MWNMVIAGGNAQAARGDGGGAPITAIEATHGMPVGEYVPGMRGHIANAILNYGSLGPSYAPAVPYTRTNNQSIVDAIVRGTANSEYGPDISGGRTIDTMAPPGQPNPQASRPDQTTVNASSAAASTVGVGTGQAAKVVRPVELPGAKVSTGGKPDVAAIMEDMMSPGPPPSQTTYEDYTQQALQDTPPPENPQADRANIRNSNRRNGRKSTAPSVNPMENWTMKPAGTGRPMPRGSGRGGSVGIGTGNRSAVSTGYTAQNRGA